MKKTLITSSLIAAAITLAGCGTESPSVSTENTAKIQATTVQAGEKYQEGIEYLRIENEIPEFKGKIVEFYWYSCIHCLNVESKIDELNSSLGREVVIQRHSQLFDAAEQDAKFDYAVRGLAPERADEINHEIMTKRSEGELDGDRATYKFLESKGLVRADIDSYLAKPEVVSRMQEMKQYELSGKFQGTPSFLIDGKFVLNYNEVGSWDEAFEIMEFVAKTKMTK